MKTKTTFSQLYSLSGFRARARFKSGILGNPRARVVSLVRRQKNDLFLLRTFQGKIPCIYLADYDVSLAKALTAGVDIWLNTPRRPQEASGTSGMKAVLNGIPNFSVLDGWWIEGHIEGVTGWSIGPKPRMEAEEPSDDAKDAEDLYRKLRNVILPLFYKDPAGWGRVMHQSIAVNGSFFNSNRMVYQYVLRAYFS